MDKELKKEALKNLLKALKGITLEMSAQKDGKAPDPSPEHEAKESPEEEALEHLTGVEAQDEPVEKENEEGVTADSEEVEEAREGEEKPTPFGSDKERILRNLYRGGQARGMVGGRVGEEASGARGPKRGR